MHRDGEKLRVNFYALNGQLQKPEEFDCIQACAQLPSICGFMEGVKTQ